MNDTNQVADDLDFVKHALERRFEPPRSPIALAVLWAGIILGGCIWSDVNFLSCGIYWCIAPVLGFIGSSFLGWKEVLRVGQMDEREGTRQALHWSCIFIGMIPVMAMAMTGHITWMRYGQLGFLISGIVYYLAGVHFDRRWLAPGLALIAASLLVLYVPRYPWTACGILIAASLLISFSIPSRKTNAQVDQ